MKRSNKFWWVAFASVTFTVLVILSLAVLFWQQLPPEDEILLIRLARDYMVYLFSAAVFLLAGLGFALDWVFRL